jgi:serine/threonine protein kinase
VVRIFARGLLDSTSPLLSNRNVGCDVRGDYKLFDFGLAKELKKKDLAKEPDTYETTGLTGSRRWMAPENCLCKHYGLSADVFSYCLLFWHVISLKVPFEKYDREKHLRRVSFGGERPNIKKMRISKFLHNLIAKGWSEDSSKRPKMNRICELMQLELLERRMDRKKKGGSLMDRSGFLMDQSVESYFGGTTN